MILEACVDWDDPELPLIGIHGERLPRRRPARSFGPVGGDEYEPSPELDLLLSHLADTDSIVHEHAEDERDYRVTLHRVKGDYRYAVMVQTHCSSRTWFYRDEVSARCAYSLALAH